MSQMIPKIALSDLQLPASSIASPAFATAAEKLAVALSRSRVAILTLPYEHGVKLHLGMDHLLAHAASSLPGCKVREWRAGGMSEPGLVEEAYGLMETAARLVLSALCRSSLLRLRSDTFSPLLDDLPLSRSTQGSSCLTGKLFVDNFSKLSGAGSTALCSNLFVDPQEETSEQGLLSLFFATEAVNTKPMSAWQVKDSEGRWQGVQLARNEVAVVLGHTMQHASAGLLQHGSHRVVGSPYGISEREATLLHRGKTPPPLVGRQQLHFELRPRPTAVLDLRPQLEAAGHIVNPRYSPVSVSRLMERFEELLSPAAKLPTPEQQNRAAAHAAWEELQASLKRTKKRAGASDETPAEGAPVTRSGNVRRSSEGLLNQQGSSRRQKQHQAAAPAAAEKGSAETDRERRGGGAAGRRQSGLPSSSNRSSLGTAGGSSKQQHASPEGNSSALYLVRGRTCTVLEDCLQADPTECVTICVRSFTGVARWFYCKADIRCGAIFEVFCARLGISLGAVKFLRKGERVFGASSPASLKMKDGEELTAVPESSDRLQQLRELGPLFSSVFGSSAAGAVSDDLEDLLAPNST